MTTAAPREDSNQLQEPECPLQRELMALIKAALQCPPQSARRRKIHNSMVRLVQQAGRLRRCPSPVYEDALQQMWLYFFENLYEVDRKKWPRVGQPFKDHPCIMGRLNAFLRGRIQDER